MLPPFIPFPASHKPLICPLPPPPISPLHPTTQGRPWNGKVRPPPSAAFYFSLQHWGSARIEPWDVPRPRLPFTLRTLRKNSLIFLRALLPCIAPHTPPHAPVQPALPLLSSSPPQPHHHPLLVSNLIFVLAAATNAYNGHALGVAIYLALAFVSFQVRQAARRGAAAGMGARAGGAGLRRSAEPAPLVCLACLPHNRLGGISC